MIHPSSDPHVAEIIAVGELLCPKPTLAGLFTCGHKGGCIDLRGSFQAWLIAASPESNNIGIFVAADPSAHASLAQTGDRIDVETGPATTLTRIIAVMPPDRISLKAQLKSNGSLLNSGVQLVLADVEARGSASASVSANTLELFASGEQAIINATGTMDGEIVAETRGCGRIEIARPATGGVGAFMNLTCQGRSEIIYRGAVPGEMETEDTMEVKTLDNGFLSGSVTMLFRGCPATATSPRLG